MLVEREIKFRAWIKDEKRMVYGKEATVSGHFTDSFRYRENEVELMQYTGLKDKNGREIYEGDILSHKLGGIGIVKFRESWGAFYYSVLSGKNEYGKIARMTGGFPFYNDSNHYEIIGNCFENYELLLLKEAE